MLLGAALVIAALLLFCTNEREATNADTAAQALLPDVVAEIEARSALLMESSAAPATEETVLVSSTPAVAELAPTPAPGTETAVLEPEPTSAPDGAAENKSGSAVRVDPYDEKMTVVKVKNYSYIGYIFIPEIKIELPVMDDWSYAKLRKAPCRYTGSTKTDNLVILAHNYSRHFGKLKNLSPGDRVIFTDMNGVVTEYAVVELETLSPYAVADVVAGEYDLTLFTCTYGGASRVVVRADRVE